MTTSNAAAGQSGGSESIRSELIDVREFAALCGCSTRTIRRLSDAGKAPKPIRLGALLRWRRLDVLAWLSAGCPRKVVSR